MAACIRGPRAVQGSSPSHKQAPSTKSIIQIYMDWGNHYLEKARSKKSIQDLQADFTDGLLLAELIEAVTNQKVPDVNRKPKTAAQMVENIKACLGVLDRLGVCLEGVTVKEVREGSLKSILALFFALSKYKQQSRQRHHQLYVQPDAVMLHSRLPTPYHNQMAPGLQTSIPTPLPHRTTIPQGSPLKCPSASSSRSTSPSHSFIPTPRSARSSDKQVPSGVRVGVRTSSSTIASPYVTSPNSKNSMLDKFKLFNHKEKTKPGSGAGAKRTSSSSGVSSSARSEQSDSSNSAHSDPAFCPSDKKENQEQANNEKAVLRKKGSKVESRLVRPGSRPSSGGKPGGGVLAPGGQLVQGPPPPPLGSSPPAHLKEPMDLPNGVDVCTGDPLRVAGGGGSGIPKPTALVKSYSKPTTQVAPMPRPSPPPSPGKLQEESKGVSRQDGGTNYDLNEEEDCGESVKPMEPLVRGYNRSGVVPHRTIPQDRNRGYRPLATYPVRSTTEANFIDTDYTNISLSSGYLSDSDMRQHSRSCDISDGYLSETGTSIAYQRIQEQRVHLTDTDKLTDESVDLSSSDGHHSKSVRVVNGGGGGVGRGADSTTPTPPHQVVYRVVGSRHVKKADSSQQTDNTAFRQVPSSQWKANNLNGRSEVDAKAKERRNSPAPAYNGVARKPDKKRIPSSGSREELDADYCNGEKGNKTGITNGTSGSSKGVKTRNNGGVGPNYGYVKRPASGGGAKEQRSAQVAALPRTKVKVSGGTQTEAGYSSRGPALGSVGKVGPAPSGGIGSNVTASGRVLQDMGPLADYAELASPYSSSWLRHSSAPYTAHSLPTRTSASGVLLEAESIESLPAQLQHRASLTHTRILGAASTAPRLSRSNSIRSTKSEKLYPSMLARSEEAEPYYSIPYSLGVGHSQPTSPTPSQMSQGTTNRSEDAELYYSSPYSVRGGYPQPAGVTSSPSQHSETAPSQLYNSSSRFNYPISPISGSPSSHTMSRNAQYVNKMASKDDDVHGSAVSLVSTASSLYSTPEEKQAHEVRKLRKELTEAQDKVQTLTHQLSTNAHVVSAFEQSLSSMTQRLQQLTVSAEKKDSELLELKQTIELLRKQSVEAGLTSGGTSSSPTLSRRHTLNEEAPISRQLSTDSVSSLNSLSSTCSLSGQNVETTDKKKKRGWLRSSFNKAFSRTKKKTTSSLAEGEDGRVTMSDVSAPPSPLLGHHPINGSDTSPTCATSPQLENAEGESGPEVVEELKKQLREKDLVLTDIRLEALSSAHQLESLKDTVIRMRNEMYSLKQDNERLQRLVTSKSLTSSQSSLPRNDSLERRFSMNDALTGEVKYDLFSGDPDGKRVTVRVSRAEADSEGCPIALLSVSAKTKWDMLDAMVRRLLKEHLDPSLGLTWDSLESYRIGEVTRRKEARVPELLPCGYLVGDTSSICLQLKGPLQGAALDSLSFDTLIPKSILQRYVSLLTEYRRIILCGPSGTGKTFLANKLAEFLALRAGKESMAEAIATFNVECKSSKELRQYLTNVAEQCETSASDLPSVIILDNLHQAASLQDVFSGFLSAKASRCPYIIGTMSQATCSTTNLQLHHNFRWILCANHMEPVKGFLGRFLRRRLVEWEVRAGTRSPELARVVDWIPRVWSHLNNFLETHSSSDVTIGPRLLLSCPMDESGSQVWFTDLWNYSIVPYLLEAVREGLQLYGRRSPWQDPTSYLLQTYPWSLHDSTNTNSLIRLRPEDVGYEPAPNPVMAGGNSKTAAPPEADGDPLMNMLMRLQEAANYSGPQTTDSDSVSNPDKVDPSTPDPPL